MPKTEMMIKFKIKLFVFSRMQISYKKGVLMIIVAISIQNHNASICILENEKYTLTIEPSPAYPYLQLYTPDHRGSIAIENLSGAPNCFNNKMGLHILQPQEVWKLETSYQLTSK